MPRREYPAHFKCAEPGCREVTNYYFSTKSEYDKAWADQKRRPFRCTRHADPGRNLRPGNESVTGVLVATRLRCLTRRRPGDPPPDWLPGLYWVPEGGYPTGSGFTSGPGFNAHAEDFPEGARLVVTARIELPEQQEGVA
jgi:hypothetical protein